MPPFPAACTCCWTAPAARPATRPSARSVTAAGRSCWSCKVLPPSSSAASPASRSPPTPTGRGWSNWAACRCRPATAPGRGGAAVGAGSRSAGAGRGPGGTVRPGSVLQTRYEPGAPGCSPEFRLPRLPRCDVPAGGARPGRSSSDGGSEELPEFRDAARSSLASRSSSSPTRPASAAFCTASMAMSWPCSAISASRAASSGLAVTDHHHLGRPTVIKTTRWAGHQESSQAATQIRTNSNPQAAAGPECLRNSIDRKWIRSFSGCGDGETSPDESRQPSPAIDNRRSFPTCIAREQMICASIRSRPADLSDAQSRYGSF